MQELFKPNISTPTATVINAIFAPISIFNKLQSFKDPSFKNQIYVIITIFRCQCAYCTSHPTATDILLILCYDQCHTGQWSVSEYALVSIMCHVCVIPYAQLNLIRVTHPTQITTMPSSATHSNNVLLAPQYKNWVPVTINWHHYNECPTNSTRLICNFRLIIDDLQHHKLRR